MNKKSIIRRGVSEEELDRFLDLFPEESRDDVIKLMMSSAHVAAIRNKKSIIRRGVSEDELNRFLDLFPEESRDSVINAMANKRVAAIELIMATKENTDDDYRSRMIVTYTSVRSEYDSFIFDQKFNYFKEEDKSFILSFVSRCFAAFKLIFSSSRMFVFSAFNTAMSATVKALKIEKGNVYGVYITLFSKTKDIALFNLSDSNAEVSDDVWNIILDGSDNINYMISAYISREYYFSDNIKKRIRALYDSLPDSEKPIAVDELEKAEAAAVAEASRKISESLYDIVDEWYARSKKDNSHNVDYLSALEKIHSALKKCLVGGEDSTNDGKKIAE